MSHRAALAMLGLAVTLDLAACSRPEADNSATATSAATPDATAVAPSSGVVREEIQPPADPTPPPLQQAVIQTQPGPDGSQVSLNKVAVTGDVMTVQLTYRGGGGSSQWMKVKDVSVIDDATAQRIGVLTDAEGKPLAAPIGTDGKEAHVDTGPEANVLWFKFPAPPATSKTVSINIPEVAPFDGVPVTR